MDLIRVGVVGLGNMGLGMAGTLARKGFQVAGYDVNEARSASAEAKGVTFSAGLKCVLSNAEAIILSLPLARDVEAVVTMRDGLLDLRDRKVIVIDTSTSDPGTSRRMAARLGEPAMASSVHP
jgi:3-hydroxyisobutyrate dehydrogenase